MLDSIKWGNPSQEHLPYLQQNKSYLDKLFTELSALSFPLNSSKGTREELNNLVDYVNSLSADTKFLKRYQSYDTSMEAVFAQIITDKNLDDSAGEIIDEIVQDITPLIFKLKYHFNRPRPQQLAASYKLKLFPYGSARTASPSYPSAHTLYGHLICHVLGNHYPEHFNFFDKLSKEIAYSRLYMGLNYESDNDFSIFVAERVIADSEFIEKYHL